MTLGDSIVIVGGGFAGLTCYYQLKKAGYQSVVVIDERSAFEYTPALHDVITAPTRDQHISLEYKKLLGDDYICDSVTGINQENILTASKNNYPFDYLVIATGSETNYFGNQSFHKHGYAFKSVADVKLVRRQLKQAQSVTVIGGGYTGVEIASVLATETDKTIQLVHSRDRILDKLAPTVSRYCSQYLAKYNVNLILNDRAKSITSNSVILESGTVVASDLTILSSGIKPRIDWLDQHAAKPSDYLTIEGSKNIYICGDAAVSGTLPTAHNAMIEGRFVAQQLIARLNQTPLPEKKHHRDWRILAIALGRRDGLITYGDSGMLPLPWLTGVSKWIIEQRVLFEFKTGIPLPI